MTTRATTITFQALVGAIAVFAILALPFSVDSLLNGVLWFALARWSGVLGAAVGTIGTVASILLIPTMLSYELPIVGLPIPLSPRSPIPNAFVIRLDVLLWAAGGRDSDAHRPSSASAIAPDLAIRRASFVARTQHESSPS